MGVILADCKPKAYCSPKKPAFMLMICRKLNFGFATTKVVTCAKSYLKHPDRANRRIANTLWAIIRLEFVSEAKHG